MNKLVKTSLLALVAVFTLSSCTKLPPIDDAANGPSIYGNSEYINTKIRKTNIEQNYNDYAHHNSYGWVGAPSLGNANLLVIPVWFTDSGTMVNNKENVHKDIEQAFFGTNEETGWRSVKTFYEEESRGFLNVNGDVSPWYECDMSSLDFAKSNSKVPDLLFDAIDWYFSLENSKPRMYFDGDADGYLDAVELVYGAHDYVVDYYLNGGDMKNNLWAYTTFLRTQSNTNKPSINTFTWMSYDFMYEFYGSEERGYGDTRNCRIDTRTYIHENGHVLSVEDYYDYDGQATPVGGFTMQDNDYGGHDPYSVMALGWTRPYIPKKSMTITINPFQGSGDVILLTPSWNEYNSVFDEYILIDYFTPTGLNEMDATDSYRGFPNKSGIRVWHVDARVAKTTDSGKLTTTITFDFDNNIVDHLCSNSSGRNNPMYGRFKNKYLNYNLLQLIRNDVNVDIMPKNFFQEEDMFYEGDEFTIKKYASQFVNGEELNNGEKLGWSFKVVSLNEKEATIKVIKK